MSIMPFVFVALLYELHPVPVLEQLRNKVATEQMRGMHVVVEIHPGRFRLRMESKRGRARRLRGEAG